MDVRKTPETFCRNPAGRQSRPVESGQQPEASLASASATAWAKRRQRRRCALLLSLETSLVGAHAVSRCGGRAEASLWPDALGPAGVEEQGGRRRGFPRNTRDLSFSAGKPGLEVVPAPKRPGPRLRVADRRERTDAAHSAVPLREPNKQGGTNGQGSECPHSTEHRVPALPCRGPRRAN
jgi:hypothetical protein